jgi:hypothetical protein
VGGGGSEAGRRCCPCRHHNWAAAEARDWDAFGALLADDVIYRGPQAREQVRGRDAYIRFNMEGFPYDWHLTVQRIVGESLHAASWTEFTGPEGTQPGLCFFDLADDGKITLITDFWPEPYELPASRAHLVERYLTSSTLLRHQFMRLSRAFPCVPCATWSPTAVSRS